MPKKIKILGFIPLPSSQQLFTAWAAVNLFLTGAKADAEDDKAIEGVKFSGESAPGYSTDTPVITDLSKVAEVITIDVAGIYGSEDEETETDIDLAKLSSPTLVTADLIEDVAKPDEIEEGALDGSEYHIIDTDQVIDLSQLTAPGNSSTCPIPATVLPPLTECPVGNSTQIQQYQDQCLNTVGTDPKAIQECTEACTTCCYDEKASDYVDCNPSDGGSSSGSSFPAYGYFFIGESTDLTLVALFLVVARFRNWNPIPAVKVLVGTLLGTGVGGFLSTIGGVVVTKNISALQTDSDSIVTLISTGGLFVGAAYTGRKAYKKFITDPLTAPLLQNQHAQIQIHQLEICC